MDEAKSDQSGPSTQRWDRLAGFDLSELPDGLSRHEIAEEGRLPLPVLARRRRSSSRLVVHLHGTLDRSRYRIPRFERLRSLSSLDTNLLLLADPTLNLERSLATGWYVGSPEDSVTDRYAEVIRAVATQWSVDHTVIAGASSGGFAALALAPRLPHALAVAFSPQTRIRLRPTARPFQQFVYNRFGGWDGIEERADLRPRVDLVELYRQLEGGRAWYIQNSGDAEHMKNHAQPFLEQHGRRVRYVEEYHCPGHNPPTTGRVVEWVEKALVDPHGDVQDFIRTPPPEVEIIVR